MTALDIRNNRIMVDIACNDPDNGVFAGRAEAISIGYDLLELTCQRVHVPRFREVDGGFVMSGKFWPTHGSKDWVGNWCWNGYWLDIPTAVKFLDWLHGRGTFGVDCGEHRIFNIWKSSRPFDDSDRKFLDRMLGKPSNFRVAA